MTKCPVCESELRKAEQQGDRFFYECLRCGPYSLSGTANQDLAGWLHKYQDGRPILSYAIYRMTKGRNDWPMLTNDLIENVLTNTALPRHMERPDNFILWVGDTQADGYQTIGLSDAAIAATGVRDKHDLYFVADQAANLGFVEGHSLRISMGVVGFSPVRLTLKGWQRYEELKKGASVSRRAFMAMKFGDPKTDSLFMDHFKAAVSATGFDLKRLDEEPRAGLIDDRLRLEIRQSKFLIADLTHHNNGAYWEAGFAEGLGKPVIYTCSKKVFDDKEAGGTHFDTNHHLTVIWDPDNIGAAVEQLKATIRATMPEEAKLED